jgi:hypothetical protein
MPEGREPEQEKQTWKEERLCSEEKTVSPDGAYNILPISAVSLQYYSSAASS